MAVHLLACCATPGSEQWRWGGGGVGTKTDPTGGADRGGAADWVGGQNEGGQTRGGADCGAIVTPTFSQKQTQPHR